MVVSGHRARKRQRSGGLGARIAARVLGPLMRATLPVTLRRLDGVPQPLDAPVVRSEGPAPIRVLLLGDGPAFGYGVTTHELAIPGHLARQLTALTGRGASVTLIADNTMRVAGLAGRLAQEDPGRYDVLAVTCGSLDAATLRPVRDWAGHLRRFLDAAATSGWSPIVVGAIPPVDRLRVLRGVRARLASSHVERMNAATEAIVAARPSITFLPFPPDCPMDRDRYRSAGTYADWAAPIAAGVADALSAGP